MGCESCSSKDGSPSGCRNNGLCSTGGCNKLEVFDWLANMELPAGHKPFDLVEIRFKNGRKHFFKNTQHLPLHTGDAVAVEASPGYDVGVVTLTGELVKMQMQRRNVSPESSELRKIMRKANEADIEKWKEARSLEYETMHKARKMAIDLGLEMKISDVEYQGDRTKATFYYTAEGRVDFRELIKVMAEQFKVRIEMRQIGARQEASRLGGIGSCGRELCCSTWLTDFRTVSTSAARYQQLSLNPQKLAGQCGKLKCCLNYELDMYLEAYKEFPDNSIRLQLKNGYAAHVKTDIFKRMMWYAAPGEFGITNIVGLKIDRVKEIIALNKNGQQVDDLKGFVEVVEVVKEPDFDNVVGQDSLTRFDEKRNKKKGRHKDRRKDGKGGVQQQNTQGQNQGKPQGQNRPQQQGQQHQRSQHPHNRPQQKQQGEQGQQNQQGGQPKQNQQGQGGQGQRRDNKNRNRGPRRDNRPPKNDQPTT
ncbi:MAG TPA: hypothetical protein DCD96_02880 [Flavobacteriales bacterium]|nr:hypothetical protein [Flavobacteriales bacterium]HRE74885.1 regulatory iron-sulfur-containing complex subunit RicT [Flavobacteriales bacterium]HRJ35852.1 regulatory iron-sulfur-containing complex subunit RicT [Flavobacteriales bacterium]HRJ37505.1 regulatory iron-sulfur-containing complex subunit RicT [Flavobacteriales bacterium]